MSERKLQVTVNGKTVLTGTATVESVGEGEVELLVQTKVGEYLVQIPDDGTYGCDDDDEDDDEDDDDDEVICTKCITRTRIGPECEKQHFPTEMYSKIDIQQDEFWYRELNIPINDCPECHSKGLLTDSCPSSNMMLSFVNKYIYCCECGYTGPTVTKKCNDNVSLLNDAVKLWNSEADEC